MDKNLNERLSIVGSYTYKTIVIVTADEFEAFAAARSNDIKFTK